VKRTAPDDPWLTTEEVARRYGRSLRTLEDWRYKRVGPRWVKLIGGVRYRLSDLLAWEQEQAKGA
jgi:Helix-turn-helix domain